MWYIKGIVNNLDCPGQTNVLPTSSSLHRSIAMSLTSHVPGQSRMLRSLYSAEDSTNS